MAPIVAIIGAGLSGISCAKRLIDHKLDINILIIEAQNRIGGRLMEINGIDFGAAWTWPRNDIALNDLAREFKVEKCNQYSKGLSLMETVDKKVFGYGNNVGPAGEGAYRFVQSAAQIPQNVVEDLGLHVLKEHKVISIRESLNQGKNQNSLVLEVLKKDSEKLEIHADYVIVCLPPQLVVQSIQFSPDLDPKRKEIMMRTPTWMAEAGKVSFFYESRFWVNKGLSGSVFSQSGPMRQIWDNSDQSLNKNVLTGFVFGKDLQYLNSNLDIKDQSNPIINQIENIFGSEALNFKDVKYKSWLNDPYLISDSIHFDNFSDELPFGMPEIRTPHGKHILFAGTETMPRENGHMNGAVLSGYYAADMLKKHIHI